MPSEERPPTLLKLPACACSSRHSYITRPTRASPCSNTTGIAPGLAYAQPLNSNAQTLNSQNLHHPRRAHLPSRLVLAASLLGNAVVDSEGANVRLRLDMLLPLARSNPTFRFCASCSAVALASRPAGPSDK